MKKEKKAHQGNNGVLSKKSGAKKMLAATLLIACSILLDVTSSRSPVSTIFQLVISLALAIAGALVAIRGVIDFLSERF
jgi:hypothetical protein